MRSFTLSRFAAIGLVLAIGIGVSGCGGGSSDTKSVDNGAQATHASGGHASPSEGADDDIYAGYPDTEAGRPFNATKGMVIETIKKATDAVDVKWEGSTLVVTFDEGSVDDTTSSCASATTAIGDGESARVVYPDGAVDC